MKTMTPDERADAAYRAWCEVAKPEGFDVAHLKAWRAAIASADATRPLPDIDLDALADEMYQVDPRTTEIWCHLTDEEQRPYRMQAARVCELWPADATAESDDIAARCQTIADEAFGPFETLPASKCLDRIESGIIEQRQRLTDTETERDSLRAELEAELKSIYKAYDNECDMHSDAAAERDSLREELDRRPTENATRAVLAMHKRALADEKTAHASTMQELADTAAELEALRAEREAAPEGLDEQARRLRDVWMRRNPANGESCVHDWRQVAIEARRMFAPQVAPVDREALKDAMRDAFLFHLPDASGFEADSVAFDALADVALARLGARKVAALTAEERAELHGAIRTTYREHFTDAGLWSALTDTVVAWFARRGPVPAVRDAVRLAAERAAEHFGGADGMFNAAGFSNEFTKAAGVRGTLDGLVVRALLRDRADIETLPGAHYRLRATGEPVPAVARVTDEELARRAVNAFHGIRSGSPWPRTVAAVREALGLAERTEGAAPETTEPSSHATRDVPSCEALALALQTLAGRVGECETSIGTIQQRQRAAEGTDND